MKNHTELIWLFRGRRLRICDKSQSAFYVLLPGSHCSHFILGSSFLNSHILCLVLFYFDKKQYIPGKTCIIDDKLKWRARKNRQVNWLANQITSAAWQWSFLQLCAAWHPSSITLQPVWITKLCRHKRAIFLSRNRSSSSLSLVDQLAGKIELNCRIVL